MTTRKGNSDEQSEAQRRKRAQLAKEKYRRLLGNRSGDTAASDSGLPYEKPPHWGDQLFTRPDRG
ncbi:hypothetical protein [Brevibacterium paucivorans]|uniref:hypothetical protein n=1 Tax=Brevibacterium paucivorans TaxID=170994 RepID=UPI0011AF4D21|nr:hypothetical protein [Brevibacterium paucivorans]